MATQLKAVLFADQVDSTANMAQRTADEIVNVAQVQNGLTARAVSLCRGRILKDTGDGHLIEFVACSDAVRCGHLIQQYVKERNQSHGHERLRFGLHVGIDYGEVVVLDSGDLRGNAVNTAARVCAHAPEGEVYFTERVAKGLNEREASFESVSSPSLKGIGEVNLFRLKEWLGSVESSPNPFIWRDGVTKAEDFFGRDSELRRLRDLLHGRQNCQIVGPRRIGKSSLLRQIERKAAEWETTAAVAYVDQQDPRCFTRQGWLKYVGGKWHWDAPSSDLAEFSEQIDEMLAQNLRPVLCLDEFEEMRAQPAEFTRDFFVGLRACGQKGLAIFTASRKQLNELTDPQDLSSEFFNTFPLLELGVFREDDKEAEDFINTYRAGVPPFTPDEKKEILEFAKRHPLALQVACYYVLEAKNRESITAALSKAEIEIRAMLPDGW